MENECTKNEKGELIVKYNINGVVEIMYQVYRHRLKLLRYPLVCRYNFDQKETLEPEKVSLFFYYLKKNTHESKLDMKKALSSFSRKL